MDKDELDDEEDAVAVPEELPPQIGEVFKEVLGQSDRAAVLVSGALVDEELRRLLKLFLFPPSKKDHDDLLDGDNPLSTFSARIKIAYRLGLIGSETTRSLNTFRQIRNDFAHAIHGCSLEKPQYRDRLRAMMRTHAEDAIWKRLKKAKGRRRVSEAKQMLVGLVGIFILDIRAAADGPHLDKLWELADELEDDY